MDIKTYDKEYIANTYARFPLSLVKGKGSLIYDDKGNEYIDMATGIAVNTFGLCDDEWVKAVTEQLNCLQHTSNLYYTAPNVKLAKMLSERTGLKKVFFSNSGAEANECAIKVARKYACDNKGKDYYNIITLKNSFHGRTITTLAATGQDAFHNDFLPLTEGFIYAEPNNIEDLKCIINNNKCAAIMLELVQGEGGVNPLDREYVDELIKIARENNVLIICDEVQVGNGRSGELYAFMEYDFLPDIVTTAKGLAGGLPLGATLLSEKVKDVLTPGSHGSTFGGNPVCCAAAINILSRIDDELLIEVKEKSKYIFNELKNCKGVKSVTGLGLMIGVETKAQASDVVNECMNNGVLVIKAKEKVRLLPALNIPFEQLKKAVDVIKDVCEKLMEEEI